SSRKCHLIPQLRQCTEYGQRKGRSTGFSGGRSFDGREDVDAQLVEETMSLKAVMLALVSGVCVLSAPVLASELRVAIPGDMRSHIPAGSTEPASTIPLSHVYEGLVGWTEDGTVAPMLAEDLPEVSEDGRVYTFTLRENVKF